MSTYYPPGTRGRPVSACTCYSRVVDVGRMVKTFTDRNPKCPTETHRREAAK